MDQNKYSYKEALEELYGSALDEIHRFALEAIQGFQQVLKEQNRTVFSSEVCGIFKLVEGLTNDYTLIKGERLSNFVHKTIEQIPFGKVLLDVKTQTANLRTELLKASKEAFALHFDEAQYGSFKAFQTMKYLADESLHLMVFTAQFGCYMINLELIAAAEEKMATA